MNPAAALSRSVSGNHLSFRSNLQGVDYHLSGPAPAATRRGVRRSSESLSFRCRLYADDCESNCMVGEGKFGFDYAKERLEKRQMFLRSYHFTTEAEEASTSNNRSTLSQKGRACLFRIRTALWTVIACNPPRAFDNLKFFLSDITMAAALRIQKDLDLCNKDADLKDKCECQKMGDNLFSWQVIINGPANTPYADGLFFLEVKFPNDYPFKPPSVKFQTKIYHCNIGEDGKICLEILKDQWSPSINMKQVLSTVYKFLEEPNADNPVDAEKGKQFKENRKQYDATAKAWCVKFAQ